MYHHKCRIREMELYLFSGQLQKLQGDSTETMKVRVDETGGGAGFILRLSCDWQILNLPYPLPSEIIRTQCTLRKQRSRSYTNLEIINYFLIDPLLQLWFSL